MFLWVVYDVINNATLSALTKGKVMCKDNEENIVPIILRFILKRLTHLHNELQSLLEKD